MIVFSARPFSSSTYSKNCIFSCSKFLSLFFIYHYFTTVERRTIFSVIKKHKRRSAAPGGRELELFERSHTTKFSEELIYQIFLGLFFVSDASVNWVPTKIATGSKEEGRRYPFNVLLKGNFNINPFVNRRFFPFPNLHLFHNLVYAPLHMNHTLFWIPFDELLV